MNIKDNPFYILNASNQTKIEKIQELCNTNMLLLQDEKYDTYNSVLSNSNTRLEAEINWFPGIDERVLEEVISGRNSNIYLNSVAKINSCRYRLSKSEVDASEYYNILMIISESATNELHTKGEYFFNIINYDREIAGVEKVNSPSKVEEQIDKMVSQALNEICQYWNNYSENEQIDLITRTVEKNKDKVSNLYQYTITEKRLYEHYFTEYDEKIKKNKTEIIDECNSLINSPYSIINRMEKTKTIISKLNTWYSYAKPMIMFQVQTEGEDGAVRIIEDFMENVPKAWNVLKQFNDQDDYFSLLDAFSKIIEEYPTVAKGFEEFKQEEIRKAPKVSSSSNISKNNSTYKSETQKSNISNPQSQRASIPNSSNLPKNEHNNKPSDNEGFVGSLIANIIVWGIIILMVRSCYGGPDSSSTSTTSKTTNSSKSSSYSSSTSNKKQSSYSNNSDRDSLNKKIDNLKSEIDDQEWELERLNDEIEDKKSDMEDAYDNYLYTGDDYYYYEYSDLYDECEDLIDEYNDLYESYEDNIEDYNNLVKKYNN